MIEKFVVILIPVIIIVSIEFVLRCIKEIKRIDSLQEQQKKINAIMFDHLKNHDDF